MTIWGSRARNRQRFSTVAAVVAIGAVMSLGAAQASAAPVLVGTSGWFWGNPLPQGENLNAVDFLGSRGFAVGSGGLILRSDDGGSTWTSLQANTGVDLARVQVVDANTVIAGGGCTIRRSVDGGATWTRLPFTASETSCSTPIAGFAFSSATVGNIALSTGAIFHTDDGGETFSGRAPVPGGAPSDLQFTSATTGVALTGQSIYRTVDAAVSWQLVKTATGTFTALDFPAAGTGYAVGAGAFMRSDDGGATWNPQPMAGSGLLSAYQDVSCGSTTTCALTAPNSVAVARTSDGGATSSSVATPAAGRLTGLSFAAGPRLVAVGVDGATVVSSDAGLSFAAIGGRLEGADSFATELRSALGARAYLTGGTGKFAQTTDGGRSWATVGVSTPDQISDLSFPAPGVGYVLGNTGTLLRTDNGGSSWRILDTGGPALRVMALDGRRVVILGQRGVSRSTNGLAFAATGSRTLRRTAFSRLDLAGTATIIASNSTVAYLTRDGGGKWAKIKTPKVRIRGLDFVTARRGFLLATNGKVYSTANAGRTWTELVALGGSFPAKIAFADPKHGFAIGDGTFRTNDGGRSWQGVPLGGSRDLLQDVVAPTATTGIALTRGPLRIFATASGGANGAPTTLSGKPSKRRLTRAGTVKFSGKLKPVVAGAIVTVDLRRGTRVTTKRATVNAAGNYSVSFKVRANSYVVAHWNGTGKFAGDGTLATRITVKPKRRGR